MTNKKSRLAHTFLNKRFLWDPQALGPWNRGRDADVSLQPRVGASWGADGGWTGAQQLDGFFSWKILWKIQMEKKNWMIWVLSHFFFQLVDEKMKKWMITRGSPHYFRKPLANGMMGNLGHHPFRRKWHFWVPTVGEMKHGDGWDKIGEPRPRQSDRTKNPAGPRQKMRIRIAELGMELVMSATKLKMLPNR